MSANDDEIRRLAQLAERAGYTTPGAVMDRLGQIIRRQQGYLARRMAARQITRYDGVVTEDIQAMAAAIQWLRRGKQPKPREDTAPFIRSRRIRRLIRIQEENTPPSLLFDQIVEYPSDQLPEWFVGLQSIVEDETFTQMSITLGAGKTQYHISIVRVLEEKHADDC